MGGRDFQTRVLVVDEEPIILETMTAILQSEGFAVRTAEDGFAALVTLRQTPPDIIISDLRMPNGLTRQSPTMLRFGFRAGSRSTSLRVVPIVCGRFQ